MAHSSPVSAVDDMAPQSVVSMIRYVFSENRREPAGYIEEKYLSVFPRAYDMVYDRICERMGGPCRASKMTSPTTKERYVYFTPRGHSGPSELPKGESPGRVSQVISRDAERNLMAL